MKKITILVSIGFLFLTLFTFQLNAQTTLWTKSIDANHTNHLSKTNVTNKQGLLFDVHNQNLEKLLNKTSYRFSKKGNKTILSIPDQEREFKNYAIEQTETMHPDLAAKYPELKTYIGTSIDGSNDVIRFSYSAQTGLRGIITKSNKDIFHIKPITPQKHHFYTSKKGKNDIDFTCETQKILKKSIFSESISISNANDGYLRKYRLAISTTGEFSSHFLDASEKNEHEEKTKVMAVIVASVERINGIFERDFGITLQLVANNDTLVYLDANTDPYSDPDNYRVSIGTELQNTLDSKIGDSQYDVGHVFHKDSWFTRGNSGGIGIVCVTNEKGSAHSSHTNPDEDSFNMLFAHELGHQFGANHTSNICYVAGGSAVEPGSGSTIMGYAGICNPDIQAYGDDYFNHINIYEVSNFIKTNTSCETRITTQNRPPVANAGSNYTIPKSTPFILEGIATDPDGKESLTYSWEQSDSETASGRAFPETNWTQGAIFRSFPPSMSSTRYIPQLKDVLAGNLIPTWEVLPAVSRTLNFAFTVRDNAPKAGQTDSDDKTITVASNSGPFIVTSQRTKETWKEGDWITVNWEVANTNIAPINARFVDILLSVDGGYTYPYVLQDNVLNNGARSFVFPKVKRSSLARVMVKASDNIFFAVNNTNFNVQQSEFTISTSEDTTSICKSNTAEYNIHYKTHLGFSEQVSFTSENIPAGTNIRFSPASISGEHANETTIRVEIDQTQHLAQGVYPFTVEGVSANGMLRSVDLVLSVYTNNVHVSELITPSNDQTDVDVNYTFKWNKDSNTETYQIQIATDNRFTNIIETAIVSENSYISNSIKYDSSYYWRIKNINVCNETNYSNYASFSTKCPNPDDFRITNIGIDEITVDWTGESSGDWEIEYGVSDFIPGTGIKHTTHNGPHKISGIQSATAYDFYITYNCSQGNRTVVGPISATTLPDYCNGDHFYDTGGANGNYGPNEHITTTIYPKNENDRVLVIFDSFSTTKGGDILKVYDGPDTNSPALHTDIGFTGTTISKKFRSTHPTGSLTFVFTSHYAGDNIGWDARVICSPKPNCFEPEDITFDILAPGVVNFDWNDAELASSWELEYGVSGFETGTGTSVSTAVSTYEISDIDIFTKYDVYIRSNCKLGGTSDWVGPFTFKTKINYCNGDHFYDTGGPDGDYSDRENITTVISPNNPNDRVRVNFIYFSLKSERWDQDYLKVYDGPDASYPPLHTGKGFKKTIPSSFISTHSSGALTFVFISNYSRQGAGWDAEVICEPQPALFKSKNTVVNNALSITPNPNNGHFVLTYAGQSTLKTLSIFDTTGKLVKSEDLSSFDRQMQLKLDAPSVGIYFARIQTDSGVIIKKMSVK